jgi:hypothetical protein
MIKIEETENRGKAVIATEKLEPGNFGLEVFTEKALVVFPTRGSLDDCSGPVPAILAPGPQLWTDWSAYIKQPLELKERILKLYTELDCCTYINARESFTCLMSSSSRTQECMSSFYHLPIAHSTR